MIEMSGKVRGTIGVSLLTAFNTTKRVGRLTLIHPPVEKSGEIHRVIHFCLTGESS